MRKCNKLTNCFPFYSKKNKMWLIGGVFIGALSLLCKWFKNIKFVGFSGFQLRMKHKWFEKSKSFPKHKMHICA